MYRCKSHETLLCRWRGVAWESLKKGALEERDSGKRTPSKEGAPPSEEGASKWGAHEEPWEGVLLLSKVAHEGRGPEKKTPWDKRPSEGRPLGCKGGSTGTGGP